MDATAVLRAADTAARSTSDDPIAMVVDGVHAMAEELWADARRSDETGLTDAKIVQSLDRIGCFRLTAPPRCGGLGEGAGAVLQTARSLARFHPSAAWNVVVSASHVANAQCFERDPFATLAPGAGDLQMAGSYGSRVAQSWREGDHHVVNGTWSMASNAQHAHWATIDAAHQDLGRVIMIMPLSELTVVDTWQAIGMRGTASHTLTADGLEVGEDSLIPFSRFTEIPEGPDSETLAARCRRCCAPASDSPAWRSGLHRLSPTKLRDEAAIPHNILGRKHRCLTAGSLFRRARRCPLPAEVRAAAAGIRG